MMQLKTTSHQATRGRILLEKMALPRIRIIDFATQGGPTVFFFQSNTLLVVCYITPFRGKIP